MDSETYFMIKNFKLADTMLSIIEPVIRYYQHSNSFGNYSYSELLTYVTMNDNDEEINATLTIEIRGENDRVGINFLGVSEEENEYTIEIDITNSYDINQLEDYFGTLFLMSEKRTKREQVKRI